MALFTLPSLAGANTLHSELSFDAGSVNELELQVEFQDVEVTVWPGDQITFVMDLEFTLPKAVDQALLQAYEPTHGMDKKTLRIRSMRGDKGPKMPNPVRCTGLVQLRLPAGKDLSVDTASGSITVVGNLGAGHATLDTASGRVAVQGGSDELSVNTASGSVAIEGDVGQLEVETGSGSVQLHGAVREAEVEVGSGSVNGEYTRVPERLKVETGSGSVRIHFPPTASLEGKVETGSGGITCDFGGRQNREDNQLELDGDGDTVEVEIETGSGSVALLRGR